MTVKVCPYCDSQYLTTAGLSQAMIDAELMWCNECSRLRKPVEYDVRATVEQPVE